MALHTLAKNERQRRHYKAKFRAEKGNRLFAALSSGSPRPSSGWNSRQIYPYRLTTSAPLGLALRHPKALHFPVRDGKGCFYDLFGRQYSKIQTNRSPGNLVIRAVVAPRVPRR